MNTKNVIKTFFGTHDHVGRQVRTLLVEEGILATEVTSLTCLESGTGLGASVTLVLGYTSYTEKKQGACAKLLYCKTEKGAAFRTAEFDEKLNGSRQTFHPVVETITQGLDGDGLPTHMSWFAIGN